MTIAARFKLPLPTAESLQSHRWLKPFAHRLADPALWKPKGEALARGVAVGMFWAFATPVAQIVFAALHCIWWRGNIPAAAAVTLITNPFTVGGWLWLAYQVGQVFITPAASGTWLATVGWPIFIGMALFAVGGAVLGYVSVRTGSRLWLAWRMARRARARRNNTK